MTPRDEMKIKIAQEAAQSGVLRFLEEAEDVVVNRLIAEYRGACNHDKLIGEVAVVAELRALQARCVRAIKEGVEAGKRDTGGGVV
jgi:hypothetical protein